MGSKYIIASIGDDSKNAASSKSMGDSIEHGDDLPAVPTLRRERSAELRNAEARADMLAMPVAVRQSRYY